MLQSQKKKQSGYGVLILLLTFIVGIIVTQMTEIAAIMRTEARYDQQLRVVQGVDAIFDAYTTYFVSMCHQDDTNIPSVTLTTLEDDGWLLLKPFNPSSATVSLSHDRPSTTTSSLSTGNRTLNNSSTVLHVTMKFPSTNENDYLLFVDALKEKGFDHTANVANLSVDIQDQVINRRDFASISNESVYLERTCI
ncbi:hypothetical protein AKH08_15970 [Vibrio parahaemolyticus]|nr:hypothetical protein AKH08_15970 [Vibrio parahaemolyticus]